LRRTATTYYSLTSGIGILLSSASGGTRNAGLIGLGAGTLATYGRPGDTFRFYELNPQVIMIATKEFTYVKDSNASVETVLGDARLKLESEQSQSFDYLVVDAFSSDAIPLHLLTREAFAIYLRHMKADGVLAFHVSNRHLDLAPAVKRVAASYGLKAVMVDDAGRAGQNAEMDPSRWVFVPLQREFLSREPLADVVKEIPDRPGVAVWTDDFSNLFEVLK
jgi:spermidine synthase